LENPIIFDTSCNSVAYTWKTKAREEEKVGEEEELEPKLPSEIAEILGMKLPTKFYFYLFQSLIKPTVSEI